MLGFVSVDSSFHPFPLQPPDMYSRGPPMPQGYPDAMAMPGMPGYPPGYGGGPQYPGQYPYGPPHNLPASAGMGAGSHTMDGYSERMRAGASGNIGGGMSPYPPSGGGSSWAGGGRSGVPPGMSRGWSGQVSHRQCMCGRERGRKFVCVRTCLTRVTAHLKGTIREASNVYVR